MIYKISYNEQEEYINCESEQEFQSIIKKVYQTIAYSMAKDRKLTLREVLSRIKNVDKIKILSYNIVDIAFSMSNNHVYLGASDIAQTNAEILDVMLENKQWKTVTIDTHCIIIGNFLYFSFNKSLHIDIKNGKFIFMGEQYKELKDLKQQILTYIGESSDFQYSPLEPNITDGGVLNGKKEHGQSS